MMTASRMKRITGFTLIELIVAIAVAAILLTVAVPSLKNLIRSNRVTGQANELVAMINFARNEAIRRNEDVPVILTSATDGWSGEVKDPAGTGSDPCTAQGALRCAEYTDVVLSHDIGDGSSPGTLTFNNRGYRDDFSAGQANIWLEHTDCSGDQQRRRITVLPTGQVSTEVLACSG